MTRVFGSMFWGFNRPGAFLWATVEDSGRVIVQADLRFKQLSPDQLIAAVRAKSDEIALSPRIIYGNVDMFPSPKKEGVTEPESPSQHLTRLGMPVYAAGSNVEHGWQRVHDYLRIAPDGSPWLIIRPECKVLIRTLPYLMQKATNPEELEGESHAAHALRVLLSARPLPSMLRAEKRKDYETGTLGWYRSKFAEKTGGVLSVRKGVLA